MMLGNLSVSIIEKELNIILPEPFRTEMKNCRQEIAEDIQPGRWHCFYFPLAIVCGDKETQSWIVKNLQPFSEHMAQQISIYIAKGKQND